jgi:hypothetical protein
MVSTIVGVLVVMKITPSQRLDLCASPGVFCRLLPLQKEGDEERPENMTIGLLLVEFLRSGTKYGRHCIF